MRFAEAPLAGAFVIEPEPITDERGSFARTFDRAEFETRGLDPSVVQCSTSFNRHRGTLRGMHYQAEPHAEAKLVRCTRGAIYDVIVDLRRDSATYRGWFGVELSAAAGAMLFVPPGLAHGFLTLEDASEIHYQISTEHVPGAARGVRFDDPAFAIEWPAPAVVVSEADRTRADFAR